MFGSCAAGTTLIAWCWCGSNFAPAGGLTSTTLLRSSAVVSWRRVAWTPSSSCSGVARRNGDRRFQAVAHRQQALGEVLDRELARLGHLFLGAAPGVLGLGLGAQVGVGQLGVAGFEVGLRGRRGGCRGRLVGRCRRAGAVGGLGRSGVVRVHPEDVRRIPPVSRGNFSDREDFVSRGRPRRSSGSSRPARAGRAWSGGRARSRRPARASGAAPGQRRLARGDAFGVSRTAAWAVVAGPRDAGRAPRRPRCAGATPWRKRSACRRAGLRAKAWPAPVDGDPALADLVGGQRARLEEACRPQPLVEAHAALALRCLAWREFSGKRGARTACGRPAQASAHSPSRYAARCGSSGRKSRLWSHVQGFRHASRCFLRAAAALAAAGVAAPPVSRGGGQPEDDDPGQPGRRLGHDRPRARQGAAGRQAWPTRSPTTTRAAPPARSAWRSSSTAPRAIRTR